MPAFWLSVTAVTTPMTPMSPATASTKFEIGPAAYTPGTKMPEQRIGSAADRAALVQFLERATKK